MPLLCSQCTQESPSRWDLILTVTEQLPLTSEQIISFYLDSLVVSIPVPPPKFYMNSLNQTKR